MRLPYPSRAIQPSRAKRGFHSLKILIDVSNSRHRSILILSLIGGLIVISGLLLSGYAVYKYTESSEFCGTLCHTMFSQYARYQSSAHVNVACADCHIGPGADHFVKSKIEGVQELIAQVTQTYQRPIKSPVENPRPARETCETCHTPTSFRATANPGGAPAVPALPHQPCPDRAAYLLGLRGAAAALRGDEPLAGDPHRRDGALRPAPVHVLPAQLAV